MPNVRMSIRKELNSSQDSFDYAMQFLYLNYSDKSNLQRFPDIVTVPESIKPEAVLRPSFDAYRPPAQIIHFTAGGFSQRMVFFEDKN